MTPLRRAVPIALLVLTGCSTIDRLPGPGEGASSQWLLAPAAAIMVMQQGTLDMPDIAMGVTLWALVDPMAPNWQIQAAQLDERHVRFSLKHKLLHTGGDGEARLVLRRNAEHLAFEQGFSDYEILRYEEGIDSTRPFARRVVTADIRLLKGRALPGL
ncbi:hypothetical protein G3580_12420 [Nitrogeniibacter mangrovi]|uniref:Uncharacterized protein n=1 Tax=Nitrogeniibacter mangrovi TaxID=2016596 RepID=A0A6C1B3Y2_9RHOO|nr:hypothetical protein [Nitrogeniibacter mangrovi]QID18372.1 hypothetical protein G3580_12420 [Nitrogeniibacter mangrovi]